MLRVIFKSMWNILEDFASKTTCHGLSQILVPGRRLITKVIWTFLVFALVGGVIWHLTLTVFEYTKYDTSTDLSEEYRSQIKFPAVTICNVNRFFDVKDEKELATVDALIRASTPARNKENDRKWEAYVENYVKELNSHGMNRFLLSDKSLSKGWLLNDTTLRFCSFQKKPCSINNFTRILTPMGLCYTFTSETEITQSVPGSGHGLVVQFDIAQTTYTEHPAFGNPNAGVKVHVHNHNEPPEVENFGQGFPSGQAGHTVLRKLERNLMYPPWGVCEINTKVLKYHKHYSTAACMRECRATHIASECNCKPYWAEEVHDVRECDAFQILECAGDAEGDFITKATLRSCGCSEPCYFDVYTTSTSYTTFPSIEVGEAYLRNPTFSEDAKHKMLDFDEFDPGLQKLRKYRENHLMIDIYYDSLSFQRTTQTKRVSEISLMSDIGGLLGLWLGISFVTVSEFVQLVIEMTRQWWRLTHVIVPAVKRWKVSSDLGGKKAEAKRSTQNQQPQRNVDVEAPLPNYVSRGEFPLPGQVQPPPQLEDYDSVFELPTVGI